ncbi:MAG: glycine cleavage system protein H [Bdellovibrionales bacterium]
MFDKEVEFTDELWVKSEEGVLIVGVKQDVFDDVNEIWGVDLPEEGGEVTPEEICGEVETDQGPVNIYSPLEGEVLEVNAAIVDDPEILSDDSTEEGWLLKIQPHDRDDLENFMNGTEDEDSDEG